MRTAGFAVLMALVAAFAGCGEDGPDRPNQPPTVELTSGPVEGETVHYSVRLEWTGKDPDGFITRYEYAVDPPPGFTEEEIAHGGPSLTVEEHAEFTRVNKVVSGELISFDWIHTTDYSRRFTFSTTDADSVLDGSSLEPTGRFTGLHAVYVRAMDNDGVRSELDKVAFTAETVAPESWITRPDITYEIPWISKNAVVEWTGIDPDGFGSNEPIGYLFKLLRLDTLDPPRPPLYAKPEDLLRYGGPWDFKTGESLSESLDVVEDGWYLLGVRAVDEAGAVEPFLEFYRNCFRFHVSPQLARPSLTLCSLPLGCIYFHKGGSDPAEIQLGVRTKLVLEVSCTAAIYGESCSEWRWGLDLIDLEDREGWSEWTSNPVLPEIKFATPGIHVLYVQVRDTLGNVTQGQILMEVIEFQFDRDVLLVDDFLDGSFPSDAMHDDFWRQFFQRYPDALTWSEFQAAGPDESSHPEPPTLEEMGRYRMILWSNSLRRFPHSALLQASNIDHTLALYLAGGGKVWINGRTTVASMIRLPEGYIDPWTYPFHLDQEDFAHDLMKLRSSRVDIARDPGANSLVGVAPLPGSSHGFNAMSVDPLKLDPSWIGGLTHVDAVFGPIFAEADPAFVGDIDSLYAYRAYGNEVTNQPSSYHGKLTALRWHDPDPDPLHGRIQWFGFPLYYMFENEAQDTFNKSLDWFREGP